MPTSDASVIQLESRKLCLSFLFGTRRNKISGATNPVGHVPDGFQHESHRKFLPLLRSTRSKEFIPCAIPNNSIHTNAFPVIV